jgi:hypothetical protein
MNKLEEITAFKRQEVAEAKRIRPLAELERARGTEDRDLIRDKTTELNRVTEHLAEVMMDAALHGALESRRAAELT